jgi:hypothetical protein
MTPIEKIQQAFLHLCWSIKLESYLRIYPPTKIVNFDNPQSVCDPDDTCFLPGDQFHTIGDIQLGAENSILLSVGALFLTLENALDEAGIENNPSAKEDEG